MSHIDLSSFVVRGVTGAVDTAATIGKFGDTLSAFIAENEVEMATIGAAVNAVFDTYRGIPLTMPKLVTYTLNVLNAQPANFDALSDRIRNYIHINADQPAQKAKGDKPAIEAEAPRTRIFSIGKGIKGGVKRWSDIPEKSDVIPVSE